MEIAVVTGTSTGIGFATSLHLARNGYRVFAGMRNLGKAEPLRAQPPRASLPLEVIELDVTSGASVDRAFEARAGGTAGRRARQQRRDRRRDAARADAGGRAPAHVRDQLLRSDPLHPGGAAGDARAAARRDRQRQLDRRPGHHPEPDCLFRVEVGARVRGRGARARSCPLRHPRGERGARRRDDEHLRELGRDDALRQELALPADHAAQRQVLRRGLSRSRAARRGRQGSSPPSPRASTASAGPSARMRSASPTGGRKISDEKWIAHGRRLPTRTTTAGSAEYFGIELR